MNLKKSTKKVKNREGSYIVEASLTLPVFILAVAALLSIIIIISIYENICFATALEMKEATLYTAFRRLETAGLIRSYWGDENSGARRRYYAITPDGLERLQGDLSTWKETKAQIDLLLEVE